MGIFILLNLSDLRASHNEKKLLSKSKVNLKILGIQLYVPKLTFL